MASPIPWTEVKALSFDIFGTFTQQDEGMYKNISSSLLGPYLPQDRDVVMEKLHKYDGETQRSAPSTTQPDVLATSFKKYAEELKVVESGKATQGQVDDAAKDYGSQMPIWPAFPDTVKATQTLGKRYKLIPLSNVDKETFAKVLAGPLKGCDFDAIYTAQDIGSYKPDLKNFYYLLDHVKSDFGIEKDQLCHVANSLTHDQAPTKEMDIQSVWVDRKGVGESPEFGYQLRVETLGELAEIVEKAFAT